jgi:hypothetical protein
MESTTEPRLRLVSEANGAPKAIPFHVGPYVYRLVITDRSLFNAEGDELEGVAVEGRRLLILSFIVEPERREEVALHELIHAWAFHVPTPRTEEERCQLHAMIGEQFRRDLEAQGGREALMQLQPQRVPHLGRPRPGTLPGVARELVSILRKCLEHVEENWDQFVNEAAAEEIERLRASVRNRSNGEP